MGLSLPNPDSPTEQARALMARKDALEAELEVQFSILKANNVTMQTPLVDNEGFPQADIDIWNVRTARVRIIELRNDLKAVMDSIAKALEGVYDPNLSTSTSQEAVALKPFARVVSVAPGSPAAAASLQTGDLVVTFGRVDQKSLVNSSLQPLAEVVAENEDRAVTIRVLRDGQTVFLTLVPKKNWGGRGMLGCLILPYTPS